MNNSAFLKGYLSKEAYVTRDVSVQDDNTESIKKSDTSHGQEETDEIEQNLNTVTQKEHDGKSDGYMGKEAIDPLWGAKKGLSGAKQIAKDPLLPGKKGLAGAKKIPGNMLTGVNKVNPITQASNRMNYDSGRNIYDNVQGRISRGKKKVQNWGDFFKGVTGGARPNRTGDAGDSGITGNVKSQKLTPSRPPLVPDPGHKAAEYDWDYNRKKWTIGKTEEYPVQ